MILDAFLMFTGVNPAAGIGNANNTDSPTTGAQASTNVIDLHMAGIPVLANLQGARDIGIGDDPAIKILVVVTTTFTVGTNMIVALQGAPDNGAGIPGSFTTWYSSPTYTEAQLVAGARLMDMDMPRPPAAIGVPRFLRLLWTSTGTHSTGQVEACLVLDRHDQMYNTTANSILGGYPPGIVIAN